MRTTVITSCFCSAETGKARDHRPRTELHVPRCTSIFIPLPSIHPSIHPSDQRIQHQILNPTTHNSHTLNLINLFRSTANTYLLENQDPITPSMNDEQRPENEHSSSQERHFYRLKRRRSNLMTTREEMSRVPRGMYIRHEPNAGKYISNPHPHLH